MYTLEGVSSVANFIIAYEESQSRLPFSNLKYFLCFQRQSFRRLFVCSEMVLLRQCMHGEINLVRHRRFKSC